MRFAISVPLVLSAFIVTSAYGADASTYKWDGVYVGGSLGTGWTDSKLTSEDTNLVPWPDLYAGEYTSFTNRGTTAGIQVGQNYQKDNLVYGVEVEGKWADIDHSEVLYDDKLKSKVDTIYLISGRIGHAWGQSLAYLKGGYATAKFKVSSTDADDTGGSPTGSGSDTQWRSGYLLGVGYEYGLSPNCIVGLTYDYVHLDSAEFDLSGPGVPYHLDQNSSKLELISARLSYKF